ncbi:MAG: Rpp14/Pop5 family protein [Candidatus Nanoarchaeia archaeon]
MERSGSYKAVFLGEEMQKKIKSLLPSLKERKRYVAIKIEPLNGTINRNPTEDLIQKIRAVLGIFDSSEAGIMYLDYDSKNYVSFIRCSASSLNKVRASLLFINELGTQQVILRSLKSSGMVDRIKIQER